MLVHKESNEPIYKKEMLLIGEKGERALNESPTGEESTIVVDPDLATLVSDKNKVLTNFSTLSRMPSKR